MRKHPASTGVTTFTSSIYNAASGQIKIGLSTTTTANLKAGRYVYDVELTLSDSTVEKVHYGVVTVHPEVTKI